jgi:hypothetical protein
LGISAKTEQMKERMSKRDANALSVRVELQADCFAGVWANRADAERGGKMIDDRTSSRRWPPPRRSATTACSARRRAGSCPTVSRTARAPSACAGSASGWTAAIRGSAIRSARSSFRTQPASSRVTEPVGRTAGPARLTIAARHGQQPEHAAKKRACAAQPAQTRRSVADEAGQQRFADAVTMALKQGLASFTVKSCHCFTLTRRFRTIAPGADEAQSLFVGDPGQPG